MSAGFQKPSLVDHQQWKALKCDRSLRLTTYTEMEAAIGWSTEKGPHFANFPGRKKILTMSLPPSSCKGLLRLEDLEVKLPLETSFETKQSAQM